MMDPIAEAIARLSPRKLSCLKHLVTFLGTEGRYPSIRDLALRMGFGPQAAWLCLRDLARDGVLERPLRGRGRASYTLTPLGIELVKRLGATAWAQEEGVKKALSLLLGPSGEKEKGPA